MKQLMKNKTGGIVLRDLFYIIMLTSGIFLLAGIFVNEMAISYDDTEMYNEFANSNVYANMSGQFYDSADTLNQSGEFMGGDEGLPTFFAVVDSLEAAGNILFSILTFPNSIANLARNTLVSLEVDTTLADIVGYLVVSLLWALILFAIITAFLKGGKM